MIIEVKTDKRGVVMHFSGESISSATNLEIDTAVARAKQKIDAASKEAKRLLQEWKREAGYT